MRKIDYIIVCLLFTFYLVMAFLEYKKNKDYREIAIERNEILKLEKLKKWWWS